MIKRFFIGVIISLWVISGITAQHEPQQYFPDPNPDIQAKIEKWQDIKFGLLMHWGPYSQWGIVESWSICPEDYDWCKRKRGSDPDDYSTYVKEYENLKTTFNPTKFNPQKWAQAAREAGMRYVVFTTKHHDGFCMFDTKYTDYKTTDMACPFHSHPKANIAREIFDAFRAQGMWTGAYFSKPDWHSDDYWWPYFPPFDRNVNYDPLDYPERWENFVQFTHNQIMELMTDYGPMDILWLDGGWVAKQSKKYMDNNYLQKARDAESGFLKNRIISQDIRMDELVEKAREKQPGLIVVDRAVPGKNQNYLTPENMVPEEALPYPWESCIIAGGGWSWVPEAQYMSGRDGIHLLVDIVAKGGNLLLNIAPGPDGTWHQEAYELLDEYAAWMAINSEAIYKTRALPPYKEGRVCFTQKKDGTIYAIYLADKEEAMLPANITLSSIKIENSANISLLGSDIPLVWKKTGTRTMIVIPEVMRNNPPCKYAWVLKIENIN